MLVPQFLLHFACLLYAFCAPRTTSGTEYDVVSLMQLRQFLHHTQSQATPKSTKAFVGQCLKFMHIPKTGGTSIDSANMHLESPAFDSLALQECLRIAASMNQTEYAQKYNSNLGELFDASQSPEAFADNVPYKNFIPSPYVQQGTCVDVHAPPGNNSDPDINKYYTTGPCNVFCVVRDPLDRFISGYQITKQGPCDPDGFESRALELLLELKKDPWTQGCFFTPQVNFVYGASSKSLATTQYCDHILHTETLNEEFDALMQEYGINLTLPEEHELSADKLASDGEIECKVQRVTQKVKDAVYEAYRADYEAFGYPRP
mmetsp:Transcript_155504/g.270489  ORF Transcript_155504/g.270489 Transcript_155504/m.270489 type:complete len:318 (-) Transcript_155504:27-980(-)